MKAGRCRRCGSCGPATPAPPKDNKPADPALAGLPALKARDSAFDPGKFLQGARTAYEMIVKAFVAGDRDALKPLTEPKVFEAFDRAIKVREDASRTESIDFLQPVRADLEAAEVEGDKARLEGALPGRIPRPHQGRRRRGG